MATLPVVNTRDKRNGIISAVTVMSIVLLILWLFKYEIASPPALPQTLEAAQSLDKQTIQNVAIAGGTSGETSSNSNKNSSQQIITNKESDNQVYSSPSNGNSNSNNAQGNNNIVNPFNGVDGTHNSGKDSEIGTDNDKGNDPTSVGNLAKRTVLSHVNADDIQYNYNAKFVFQVGINADGYPVDIQVIKSLTTTSDERIIRKVAALVKQQVRYSKSKNNGIQTVKYTVNFKAL